MRVRRDGRQPRRRAAELHDGRSGLRPRVDADEVRTIVARGLAASPIHEVLVEQSRLRVEGVRARADARPQRQRGRGLLDRERRSDGRAHRRLDHRRTGDDAHRPRIPAHARCRHRRAARRRRRHRRLQHPVRGRSGRRANGRHRDEPARLPVERARLQGHRLPDRQDRGEAGRRLHPRRDPQRHHPRDAGCVRARRSTTSWSRCRDSRSRSSRPPIRCSPRT